VRSPYDQFAKRLSRDACRGVARVETDAEVEVDTLRFDLWVEVDPLKIGHLARFGLLGDIFCSAPAIVLDIFRSTPSLKRVVNSHRKHLNFCHDLPRRKPPRPEPSLWMFSAGRPTSALEAFYCAPYEGWVPGVYRAGPVFDMRIVVISELPRTRETLLLRLMGSTPTIELAREDLKALPETAPERHLADRIVLDILDRIPKDRKRRSTLEQEFWETMHSLAKELKEQGRKQGLKQGRKQGLQEGLEEGLCTAREMLTGFYEELFGPLSAELLASLQTTRDLQKLTHWSRVVARGDRAAADRAILEG